MYDQNQRSSGDDLVEVSTREKELEILCKEQAAKLEELNKMVEEYKHVAEQPSIGNRYILALEAPSMPDDQNKGTSSICFSSSKISRISFVDLAGIDRNKPDDAGRQLVRESKYVKKSLSQLGQIVSSLAKEGQPGKLRGVPYEESCLTHLLRESLGGNAKLTVICNISPDNRNDNETLRTLRFGIFPYSYFVSKLCSF